jgi:beta-lactamase class A
MKFLGHQCVTGVVMKSGMKSFLDTSRYLVLVPALALAGCIPQAHSASVAGSQSREMPGRASQQRQVPVRVLQTQPTLPPAVARPAAESAAQRALSSRIQQLGRDFPGEVGIAVRDVETGWTTSWNGGRHYPQQSVSKFWVALNAFQRADAGQLDLSEQVTVRREDLTLFHQPIAQQIGANGYSTTLENLIVRALTQSDNTANDFVLRRGGGPEAIRAMLERHQLTGIRFGPGERLMQSQIAGLQWQPSYSVGNAFFRARASVPLERRRELFNEYVADPIDGATPEGLVEGLARLRRGELLSPRSTEQMLSIMSRTRTGPQRLTGGLATGWRIAHKTGTGQVLGSTQTGYNDIGIITAPDGRHYAIAVMIGRTSTPLETRMDLMQNVTRAAIDYHGNVQAGGASFAR